MLIYGKQPVYYLISRHPEKIETLYLAKELEAKEYNRLMRMGFEVKRIPQEAAQKMSRSGNHQGFLAETAALEPTSLHSLAEKDFVVVLCGITDVGNIGAIVRSAYALGADGIIATGIKSLALEPVVRSSTGALYDLPFNVTTNLYDVLTELKNRGHRLYGAVMEGEDVRTLAFEGKRALLLGNEGEGIPARAVRRLDQGVRIAMAHGFDSLNVSAAGAILMERMRTV
ncbi:RNA methyltransferase [Sulfurimonas sp. HSL-1656]|uniref:TrmH family RNA methyltransferase n=1 Tax=Thiomicrolovo subterrani TaxID=3131934 RepID=UPI0031F75DEE